MAVDQKSRTLYVPSGATNKIYVVDISKCTAQRGETCGAPVASVGVGAGATGIAVDERTHTVYVANADNGTVSVIDGKHCNARVVSGCGASPSAVTISGVPLGIAIDETNGTVYVGNVLDYVSVINGHSCNGSTAAGCSTSPKLIAAGPGPAFPTFDAVTDTLYVPDDGPEADGSGNTMSIIDARTCNAVTTSGCDRTPVIAKTGPGPVAAVIDDSSGTVYVENSVDGTVSVIDRSTCNARVTSGCSVTPSAAPVGPNLNSGLALDSRSNTLFVVNGDSDTISAVDIRHCRARDTSGCHEHSRTLQGGNTPDWILFDPVTDTLFVPNFLDDDVSVLDARSCNAMHARGCRVEAPVIDTGGADGLALDPIERTVYVTEQSKGGLALIDTGTCSAVHLSGCRAAAARVPLGMFPRAAAVDIATHTLYVTDLAGRVLVLNTATCTAAHPAGCVPLASVPVGAAPVAIAVRPQTHTVYTANIGDDTASILQGARCNAINLSGCGGPTKSVAAGESPFGVTIDPATDTVYVADFGHDRTSHGVSLLPGSACETGSPACTALPQKLTVGRAPIGLTVDSATGTLYVANQATDDELGSASVADTRTCNAANTSGCATPKPTVPTGRGTWAIAIDPAAGSVFTANWGDGTVSAFSKVNCNATHTQGCDRTPRRVATGNGPDAMLVDMSVHTLYVSNSFDGTVSVIDSRNPCGKPSPCLSSS